jgi:hypothetical protein
VVADVRDGVEDRPGDVADEPYGRLFLELHDAVGTVADQGEGRDGGHERPRSDRENELAVRDSGEHLGAVGDRERTGADAVVELRSDSCQSSSMSRMSFAPTSQRGYVSGSTITL